MPPLRLAALAVLAAALAGGGAVAGAQEPPPDSGAPTTTVPADTSGRQWLVPVPTACEVPALPDVVFVGTLLETGTPAGAPETAEYETARFKVDQARAGAIERFSYGGFIDVRYGIDTKYLDADRRYLVGASVDPTAGVLVSKVQEAEPQFGGDEVIGAAESDVKCPVIEDPVRTLDLDGTSVDAGVVTPFLGAKRSILRALLIPTLIAFGVIFGLALLRWLLTGIGYGVSSVVRTAAEPREVRAATRTRPNVRPE